jgi:hypothetical protein
VTGAFGASVAFVAGAIVVGFAVVAVSVVFGASVFTIFAASFSQFTLASPVIFEQSAFTAVVVAVVVDVFVASTFGASVFAVAVTAGFAVSVVVFGASAAFAA